MVLLESKTAAIHENLDDVHVRAQLVNVAAEDTGKLQKLQLNNSGHSEAAMKMEAMMPTDSKTDEAAVRQRGDFKLYLFFLKTVGMAKACFWFIFTAIAMFIEKFPGKYINLQPV